MLGDMSSWALATLGAREVPLSVGVLPFMT